MFKKIMNRKGFGLLEIIVASALLGVLSLGVVAIIELTTKSGKTAGQDIEITTLVSATMMVLNDQATCKSAFTTAPITMPAVGASTNLPGIFIGVTPVVQLSPVNYNGLEVTEIKLNNDAEVANWLQGGNTYTKNMVTIDLRMKKAQGTFAPEILRHLKAIMVVNQTGGNIVTDCAGLLGTDQSGCEAAGGTFNALATPKCQWNKFAVSDNAADFNNNALYPDPAGKGIYTKDGININGGAVQIVASGDITTVGIFTSNYAGVPSDIRLKQNVRTIDHALEKTLRLRGVQFEWKNKKSSLDQRQQVGVIAQEVEKVVPEVVLTTSKGTKVVEYGNLVGVLIEAIKAQQKQIDELKAERK